MLSSIISSIVVTIMLTSKTKLLRRLAPRAGGARGRGRLLSLLLLLLSLSSLLLCVHVYIYIYIYIFLYFFLFSFLTQLVFPTSTWCLLRRWTGDPPETLSGLTSNPLSFSIRLSDRRQDLNPGPPPPELTLQPLSYEGHCTCIYIYIYIHTYIHIYMRASQGEAHPLAWGASRYYMDII